jgi:purine-cytosine permease-like protein
VRTVALGRTRRRTGPSGSVPLTPKRKWQTITIATLLLAPAFWSLLAGIVAVADDDKEAGPNAAAAIAFGLAFIPFIYVVLAFMSQHPRAPRAVVRAMGLTLLVGLVASGLAQDAVTGIVAGLGAGGIAAMRRDPPATTKARVWGVVAATVYTFVLVRMAGPIVLVAAPIFPFTAIGLADHFVERRLERAATRPS